MKKSILFLMLLLFQTIIFSQKKKKNVNAPVISIENATTKSSKLVEKIKLKGVVYSVYLKSQKPSEMMDQKENDTLIEYHFTSGNSTYTILEIQKYATINGKIAREGFYKIKGDTLITSVNYYDPYHGGNLTNKYIPAKYGRFEEVKSEMKGIDTEILSDKYIKTEKMKSIYDSNKN